MLEKQGSPSWTYRACIYLQLLSKEILLCASDSAIVPTSTPSSVVAISRSQSRLNKNAEGKESPMWIRPAEK